MSKRYGLRRRLKRLAKADGVTVPNDWTVEQIAGAIADKWNEDWLPIFHRNKDGLVAELLAAGDGPDDDQPF